MHACHRDTSYIHTTSKGGPFVVHNNNNDTVMTTMMMISFHSLALFFPFLSSFLFYFLSLPSIFSTMYTRYTLPLSYHPPSDLIFFPLAFRSFSLFLLFLPHLHTFASFTTITPTTRHKSALFYKSSRISEHD